MEGGRDVGCGKSGEGVIGKGRGEDNGGGRERGKGREGGSETRVEIGGIDGGGR